MESTSAPHLKKFYAVSLTSGHVVSLITETYFLLQNKTAPVFYRHFTYTPFCSSRSFTDLHRILPFRLVEVSPGKDAQIEAIDKSSLSLNESGHLRAHLYLLDIYKKHHLDPIPPWLHIQRGSAGSDELSLGLADLEMYANALDPECVLK